MNEVNIENEAIALNEDLSIPLKKQLEGLTEIFHQTFKNVSLDNYNERIKDLKIKRGSKYLIKTDSEYKPKENVLYLNEEKLKETDAMHSMMMCTLKMITAKDHYYGINDNGKLEGINAGLTEIIANNLVGNECEEKYCDEMILTNLIVEVAGFSNTLNAYFNNNSMYLTKPFMQNSKNPEKASQLLDKIQYNYEMKDKLGYSSLKELEKELIELTLSEKNIDYFKNNSITNSDLLPKNIKYNNVINIEDYFNKSMEENKKVA